MSGLDLDADSLPESSTSGFKEVAPENRKSKEFQVAFGDKDEESDVAKDEKRDTEKPLLKEHETITIEQDVNEVDDDTDKAKGSETPTLPLPQRIGKRDQGAKPEEEPPSMFFFPIARIKYTWETSDNLFQFFTRTICILFASLGWMVLVGGVPLLSIVQLAIGSIYIQDCPLQPRIAEYLIVAGVFGIILHAVAVFTKYTPKNKRHLFEDSRKRCLCIEAILQIFLLVWFIAGCFWVYTIFEPEYQHKDHPEYCNKTLYLFTFWMFNITFIICILFVILVILCITCVAMNSNKFSE